jgi:hypothetical protein
MEVLLALRWGAVGTMRSSHVHSSAPWLVRWPVSHDFCSHHPISFVLIRRAPR